MENPVLPNNITLREVKITDLLLTSMNNHHDTLELVLRQFKLSLKIFDSIDNTFLDKDVLLLTESIKESEGLLKDHKESFNIVLQGYRIDKAFLKEQDKLPEDKFEFYER